MRKIRPTCGGLGSDFTILERAMAFDRALANKRCVLPRRNVRPNHVLPMRGIITLCRWRCGASSCTRLSPPLGFARRARSAPRPRTPTAPPGREHRYDRATRHGPTRRGPRPRASPRGHPLAPRDDAATTPAAPRPPPGTRRSCCTACHAPRSPNRSRCCSARSSCSSSASARCCRRSLSTRGET